DKARQRRHQHRIASAAAADQPAPRRQREMLGRARRGRRGHRRQGRGAIGGRESGRYEADEIITVERFRRRPIEESMREEALDESAVGTARGGQRTVEVDRKAVMRKRPIVDQRVPWPGVESKDVAGTRTDPGDVGDAAYIEDGNRLLQLVRARQMIKRREGSTLTARRDIGGAEVADHIDAGQPGQQGTIAELPRPPLLGPVQDGVAVEADEVHVGDAMLMDERAHRLSMRLGHRPLDLGDRTLAAQRCAQAGAQRFIVGPGERRAGGQALLAVGLDESRVDAVERGATHEADDAVQRSAHGRPANCRATVIVLHGRPRRMSQLSVMSAARSSFIAAAEARGFVHQLTDREALAARLAAGPVAAYIGYDCTADSLHVGNLVSIMLLRLWQTTGNKPIVLMGGGTSKVGDPSGKDETRRLLSEDEINHNMASIRRVFGRFLSFDAGPTGAVMVNNADW